uniref:2Fe-2S ferredoxin-type domain-containing protein n=1 Tax=Anabas testudineus TaxID=64144 RepID=A0A7N6AWW2_ANATE
MALVTALRRLTHVSLREFSRKTVAVTSTSRTRLTGFRSFTVGTQPLRSDKVTVHFINRDGEKITVKGSPGDTLLDVTLCGVGACEGTLACSTCHLIFDDEVYKKLGRVTDEEMDMLDLAYGLTETSRLGCQICLTKSLEGMVARVPESITDLRQSKDESA